MSFSSLATVELQLIMHACDVHSLLALARCSRSTLAAASSPFAWSRMPAVPVSLSASELSLGPGASPSLSPSSLLRRCPVALRWIGPTEQPQRPIPVTSQELEAVASIPHLRALDARERHEERSTKHVQLLLDRLAPGSLTSLRTSRLGCISQLERLVERQPQLTSLHLCPPVVRTPSYLAPLTSLSRLTELAVCFTHVSASKPSGLMALAQCASLRVLRLESADVVSTHQLLAHLASSGALEDLSLCRLVNPQASMGGLSLDWPSCFSAFRSLRRFRLEGADGCAAPYELPLLSGLSTHCPPSLRALQLEGLAWGCPSIVLRRNGPALAQLEELTLLGVEHADARPEVWDQLFAALSQLCTLRLLTCTGVDALLAHVAAHCTAPSLRIHVLARWIVVRDLGDIESCELHAPSAAVLRELLQRSPSVSTLRVDLPLDEQAWEYEGELREALAIRAEVQAALNPLLAEYAGRLELRMCA